MHFSVAVMLCDMPSQLTSIPLNLKYLCHLVTFAKGRFWEKSPDIFDRSSGPIAMKF